MANLRAKSNKELNDFLETIELLESNQYEVLGKYLNADTYIHMKHKECDRTFHITPGQFKKGQRCPFCAK